jgi:hypothetical protein
MGIEIHDYMTRVLHLRLHRRFYKRLLHFATFPLFVTSTSDMLMSFPRGLVRPLFATLP